MATKLLTTAQAAIYCGVTPDSIRRWARARLLPTTIRLGPGRRYRFSQNDLDAVLNGASVAHDGGQTGRFRPRLSAADEDRDKVAGS